jgi:hypothetical protein
MSSNEKTSALALSAIITGQASSHRDGIYGIGAQAALMAMLPHWMSHTDEGHLPTVIVPADINGLIERLQVIRDEVLQELGVKPSAATDTPLERLATGVAELGDLLGAVGDAGYSVMGAENLVGQARVLRHYRSDGTELCTATLLRNGLEISQVRVHVDGRVDVQGDTLPDMANDGTWSVRFPSSAEFYIRRHEDAAGETLWFIDDAKKLMHAI